MYNVLRIQEVINDEQLIYIPWWKRNILTILQLSSLTIIIIGAFMIWDSDQKGVGMRSKHISCDDSGYIRHMNTDDCYERICSPTNLCIEFGFGISLTIIGSTLFVLFICVNIKTIRLIIKISRRIFLSK